MYIDLLACSFSTQLGFFRHLPVVKTFHSCQHFLFFAHLRGCLLDTKATFTLQSQSPLLVYIEKLLNTGICHTSASSHQFLYRMKNFILVQYLTTVSSEQRTTMFWYENIDLLMDWNAYCLGRIQYCTYTFRFCR